MNVVAQIIEVATIHVFEVATFDSMFNQTEEDVTPVHVVEIVEMLRRAEKQPAGKPA